MRRQEQAVFRLTEPEYFKGDKKYLKGISENVSIPFNLEKGLLLMSL